MTFVLTFISSSTDLPLDKAMLPNDLKQSRVEWLEEGKALDVYIDRKPDREELNAYRAAVDEYKIDVLLSRVDTRRKKLLIADMDSTIVTGETLDDLAAFAGIKDKVAAITARAMNGELGFHDAIRERVGLLKGLSVNALQQTLDELRYNKGAQILVKVMQGHGAKCILISGGFTFFTQAVADEIGFDAHHGNTLGIDGDVLSGLVIDPILDKNSKLSYLKQYIADMNITPADTAAVGDGANDLPMLQYAGLGVGYYAKSAVAAQVDNVIKYGDLTALLYVQGYKAF